MLDTILGILGLGIIAVYLYAGDQANYYLKYHLLNQRAEIYSDTFDYILKRILYAGVLGWVTIPIALLHYNFSSKKNNNDDDE